MLASKLTSKGQVTIPRLVRERLGLHQGDAIEFVEDDGCFRIAKRVPGTSPFAKYRGFLKHLEGREPDEIVEQLRGS